VGYTIPFELGVKVPQVLTAVVRLPSEYLSRIDGLEPGIEVLHVLAGAPLVVERYRKPGFDVHGTVEVVSDPVRQPLYRIGEDMTEVSRSR